MQISKYSSKYFVLSFCLVLLFSIAGYAQSNPEPEIKDIYFTNRTGEKVEEVTYSDKIMYMVVETRNAIGEQLVLELDEEDGEFIYKREFMTANSQLTFDIKKDLERIKFIIYNPSKKSHVRIKAKHTSEKTQRSKTMFSPFGISLN